MSLGEMNESKREFLFLWHLRFMHLLCLWVRTLAAAYTIPRAVQPDSCCCHQPHYRSRLAWRRLPMTLCCSHTSSKNSLPHTMLCTFVSCSDATVTWDSRGFNWHSCTCNPEVWESRCLVGGVWNHESWESINAFLSLPPPPLQTVWSWGDYTYLTFMKTS